jgi:transcriptional regulator with XRE-family HTH domain
MKLKTWIAQNKVTHEQFSESIGVSRVTVTDWVNEKTFPTQEHREMILEATQGKVKPSDFAYPASKITNKIDEIPNISRITRWRNEKKGWGIINFRNHKDGK